MDPSLTGRNQWAEPHVHTGRDGRVEILSVEDALSTAPGDLMRVCTLEGLVLNHGYEKVGSKGSHNAYIKGGRIITVVRPHGGKKFCHPLDVKGVLDALEEK